MTVHGKEQGYVYTLALCSVGPVLYELMESVEGPSILEEFLDERGEGLHHLGYLVPDIDWLYRFVSVRFFRPAP